MSDSIGEDVQAPAAVQTPATVEPTASPARVHFSTDRGPRGEQIFANQVAAAADPVEARRADTQFSTFMEERRAEAAASAAREAISQETSTAPRVSETMKANAEALESMMKDPARAAQIKREIDMAHGVASGPATAPVIDTMPQTTWGRVKDSIAAFLGFGKKQEPIREV